KGMVADQETDSMELQVENVSVTFPALKNVMPTDALQDIDLTINDGEFVVAIGASGCGKSTLLSLIAGFLAPTSGHVLLDGMTVQGPGAERSVVFQNHALMPWLNVQDNVAFGLKLQGVPKAKRYEVGDQFI